MKKIGEYTVRGTSKSTTTKKIILNDGRFDTGYVITRFEIIISDPDNSGVDAYGVLLADEPASTSNVIWDLESNVQMGWASMTAVGSATGPQAQPFSLVDRDNLIIEDLFIYVETNAAGLNDVNYYIEMDKYEFTDSKGALAMVRNRSQGDSRD
jgi:hypothetical protein